MIAIRKSWVVIGVFVFLLASVDRVSAQLPPNPIVPNQGEQVLLDLIKSMPLNEIRSALDHFPVPYVVVASANGASPVLANNRAGAPTRIDADGIRDTGFGGQDIQVEVNTELSPVFHLRVNINRLGSAPFARDVKVVIAFPWRAFNKETLPGDPNLYIGYQTTGAFAGNSGYPAGGNAPETTEINFYPNVVAGLVHNFQVTVATTGASNPVRFIAGHFDGTNLTGLLNADGQSILTDPVPANFAIGLGVNHNPLSSLPTALMSSTVDVTWTASAPAKVIFDYIEDETTPSPTIFDYNSGLTFDKMPTSAHLTLELKEAEDRITVTHTANAVIGAMTLLFQRNDRLTITGSTTDVPTQVGVTLNPRGCVSLDVNANTLDLNLIAIEDRGFANTSGFFGRPIKYAEARGVDLPDTRGCFGQPMNVASLQAVNPGESIPLVELTIATNDLNVQKAPVQPDGFNPVGDPNRHIFSLIDDGIDGTAFARMVHLVNATFDLTAAPPKSILQRFNFTTARAAPLTGHIRNKTPSTLIPHPPNDVDATCNLSDIPAGGPSKITLTYPTELDLDVDPLKSLHCWGKIDSLEFDIDAADIPEKFKYKFDPNGSLTILTTYKDLIPNKAKVGHLAVRLTDETGLPNPLGIDLVGVPLKNARARVDDMYSFVATWSDKSTGSSIDFNTGQPDVPLYAGGAQIDLSTIVVRTHLPAASPASDDYLTYMDGGPGKDKRIAAGVFGLDHFNYTSFEDGGNRSLGFSYETNLAHKLVAQIDTRKDGRFFPDFDINQATLIIDKIPATLIFTTDLATSFKVAGSTGIDLITMTGGITINNDTTTINTLASKIPAAMQFLLHDETEGSVEVTTTGVIDQLKFDLQSDTKILSKVDYKHLFGDVHTIPADFAAHWGENPLPHADVKPGQPLGTAKFIVSRIKTADEGGQYGVFTTPNSDVEHTDFARQIDVNYFKEGPNPAGQTRQQLYIDQRVDPLYRTTIQLGSGEDHAALRKNAAGKMDFLSFQLTGVKSFNIEIPKDGAKGTLELGGGVARPFYAGVETERAIKQVTLNEGAAQGLGTDSLSAGFVDGAFNPRPGFQAFLETPNMLFAAGGPTSTFGLNNMIDSMVNLSNTTGLKLAVERFEVMDSFFLIPRTYGTNSVTYSPLKGFDPDFLKGLTIEVERIDLFTGGPGTGYIPTGINESTRTFPTDSLKGLFIEAGGETHLIVSNIGHLVTINEPWGKLPDGDSPYAIFRAPQAVMIASNNGETLTLVEPWKTQPPNDTSFLIYRPAEEHWVISSTGTAVTLREPWVGHIPFDGTPWRIYRNSETHGIKQNNTTTVFFYEPWLDSVRPPVGTAYRIYYLIEVGTFVTAKLPKVPGKTVFDVSSSKPTKDSSKGSINITFSESPGAVLIYKGELPRARDFTEAMKVMIPSTPTSVQISFDMDSSGGIFGTPQGDVHVHLNNPTEIGLITQSETSRILGDFVVKDFDTDWGTKTFKPDANCNFNPLSGPVGCDFSLTLLEVGLSGKASPGLQGFLNIYTKDGDPHFFINTPTPRPRGSGEYSPSITLLAKDLTEVKAGVGMRACVSLKIPPNVNCSPTPRPYAEADYKGSFNFDWWDQGGGPIGLFGNEDYVENNPWHLWPLINSLPHSYSDHLTPLAP